MGAGALMGLMIGLVVLGRCSLPLAAAHAGLTLPKKCLLTDGTEKALVALLGPTPPRGLQG